MKVLEPHRLSWLNPLSKAFIKVYYFPKFHCHILGLSKVRAAHILTIFNKFSLQHVLNQKYYGLFSEACSKIPELLPSSQNHTLKLIRYLLFSTRIGKFRPNHTKLKGMHAGQSKVFPSINAMKLLRRIIRKKLLFSRNTCT